MEDIMKWLESLVPKGFSMANYFMAIGLVVGAAVVLAGIGRLLFGKKSTLNQSISAAIGILFIYALTIVAHSLGLKMHDLLAPLPFVALNGENLLIFNFAAADYTAVCGEVLNMIILAFLVNLISNPMPKGKNLFTWLFFRTVSVSGATILYAVATNLITAFVPEGLLTYSPVVLLAILLLMLATGALKLVVGALMATVNPLIAFLYTFFFANIIGKQITKAILTTGIIAALVYGLNYCGIVSIFIGASALTAYIPLLIILLALWFIVGKLL